jgi:hypothetical protein
LAGPTWTLPYNVEFQLKLHCWRPVTYWDRFGHGHGPQAQSLSPAWVRWLMPFDVVVVVAVLDHLALAVEAQHCHSRVAEFLALLGPAGPPFDRGPAARDNWLAKPALDVFLGRELLGQIAAHTRQAQVRRAERG